MAERNRPRRFKKMVKVEFVECPYGHGCEAIVIDGTRITGEKCCGSWETRKSFTVAASTITEALAES